MALRIVFSKLTKYLSRSASSNDMMEIAKLNGEIDNEEKKKGIIYIVLGKLVYNSYINNN